MFLLGCLTYPCKIMIIPRARTARHTNRQVCRCNKVARALAKSIARDHHETTHEHGLTWAMFFVTVAYVAQVDVTARSPMLSTSQFRT